MKTWIVRFVALYVFNVIVLLLIGALLPSVRVGWSALWASVILTIATLWVTPAVRRVLDRATGETRRRVPRASAKAIEYATTFVVALIVWLLVTFLSGVSARGFIGFVVPPLALLLAWIVYDVVDDRFERTTGDLVDRATGGRLSPGGTASPSTATDTVAGAARDLGSREIADGLTPEQRRMLDELD